MRSFADVCTSPTWYAVCISNKSFVCYEIQYELIDCQTNYQTNHLTFHTKGAKKGISRSLLFLPVFPLNSGSFVGLTPLFSFFAVLFLRSAHTNLPYPNRTCPSLKTNNWTFSSRLDSLNVYSADLVQEGNVQLIVLLGRISIIVVIIFAKTNAIYRPFHSRGVWSCSTKSQQYLLSFEPTPRKAKEQGVVQSLDMDREPFLLQRISSTSSLRIFSESKSSIASTSTTLREHRKSLELAERWMSRGCPQTPKQQTNPNCLLFQISSAVFSDLSILYPNSSQSFLVAKRVGTHEPAPRKEKNENYCETQWNPTDLGGSLLYICGIRHPT